MFLSLTKFLHLTSLPKKRDHCDKMYVWGSGMPLSSIKQETALYNLFTLKTAYFLSCVKCCHQSWQRYLYFYFFPIFSKESWDDSAGAAGVVESNTSYASFGSIPWHQAVSHYWRKLEPPRSAWSPQSEHAKADSGISFSESLEEPNLFLSRETTVKCHRAPNGKNNLGNKRVKRGVQTKWNSEMFNIIYSYVYTAL